MEELAEGVILRVSPFSDHDLIVTLFAKEQGILTLFDKGGQRRQKRGGASAASLTCGEFTFRRGKEGQLHRLCRLHTLLYYGELRNCLEPLEAAATMGRALLRSQLPGKGAPLLYQLFTTYLKELPRAEDPQAVAASFLLKNLKHDGLLPLPQLCSLCQRQLSVAHFSEEGWGCGSCVPKSRHSFSAEEREWVIQLMEVRALPKLLSFQLPLSCIKKVEQLFSEIFD